jgi:hypothetical protein
MGHSQFGPTLVLAVGLIVVSEEQAAIYHGDSPAPHTHGHDHSPFARRILPLVASGVSSLTINVPAGRLSVTGLAPNVIGLLE